MESNLFLIHRKNTTEQDPEIDFHLLEGLDRAIESHLSLGKIKKASDCMTQALNIYINLYGDTSKEVLSYLSFILKRTCSSCSLLIEKGNIQDCIEILRNLLLLSSNYPLGPIASETCEAYNTLAVALRKTNKPKIAKKYAMKALSLSNSFKAPDKLSSSIYLNLCAIYSSLSQHKEAATYCQKAIQLAQEDLLNLKLSNPKDDYSQEVAVLAVAYYNLAVEEEHLKNYEISLNWYRKAVKFLEKHASPSHFNMLEEFKRSYEDAQKVCKMKYSNIHLNRTMKEDYFFNESSMSEIDMKSDSIKGKTVIGFRQRVPNLAIGKFGRSESGSSFALSSKKMMEMDSDIRELENLGLLEHDKMSSRRSKSSMKSGDLSPIKKSSLGGPKNFDFSEKVFKIRKEDSARKRKVIRTDRNKEALALRAVLRIQSFFRFKRIQKWYKDMLSGKLFGSALKCEKMIDGQKYLVSFSIEKGKNKLGVTVKAQSLNLIDCPRPRKYSLYEVCSLINAWNSKSFEIKKSELLIYISIENKEAVLKKSADFSMKLLYQNAKRLNNMFSYQISIYFVLSQSEQFMLIDGRPLKKSPPIISSLIISEEELSSVLSVKPQDLQINLDKVMNLVIFEGEGELTLSKRSISSEIPMINILTTNTDDFTDQYKQYENSSKRIRNEKTNLVKFCFGSSDKGKAALTIQKNMKAYKKRKEFLKLKNIWTDLGVKSDLGSFNKALVVIQKYIRGWKARKMRKRLEKEKQKGLIMTQALFRGWNTRKEVEKQREKIEKEMENAVVLIQSKFKSLKIKKKFQETKDKKLEALGIIRQGVVEWVHRTRESCLNARNICRKSKLKSVILIQSALRSYLAKKKKEEMEKSLKRNWKSRKVFRCKLTELRSVKIIQRFIRNWLANRRKEKQNATLLIQKHYKGRKARKRFIEIREKQLLEDASIRSSGKLKLIQNAIKRFFAYLSVKELKEKSKQTTNQKKRKDFHEKNLNGLDYLNHASAGVSLGVFLKAVILIQKYVRAWKVRKIFNFSKCPAGKLLKSIVNIQRFARGMVFRNVFSEFKYGNLIINAFFSVFENSPYLVMISKIRENFIVKAVHCLNKSKIIRVFDSSLFKIDTLMENLYLKGNRISISENKTKKPFRFILHEGEKQIDAEIWLVQIFLEPDGYLITLSLNKKSSTLKVKCRDLIDKYSEIIDLELLKKDIKLSGNKIFLDFSKISLKKIKNTKYGAVILTMYEKGDYLKFEAINGTNWKHKINVDYNEAVKLTGIISGKYALGNYIMDYCLIITKKRLIINYRHKQENFTLGITKVQALIRLFLTKRMLKQKNLILTYQSVMKDNQYRVFCYFYMGKYSIIAKNYSESFNLSLPVPPNTKNHRDYLRKSVVPYLILTDTIPTKLSLNKQIFRSPKLKLDLLEKSSSFDNTTPAIKFSSKRLSSKKLKILKPKIKNRDTNLCSEQLSPQQTPTIHLKKTHSELEETLKSLNLEKIVLKTGATISGVYLIVTMKLQEEGLHVRARNETGKIDLELYIKTERVKNISEKEAEDLCTELMTQLKIMNDLDGKMRLALIDENEEKDEVIYRKSHFISYKYLTITIFENKKGVFLVAAENDRKIFHLELGRRRVGNSQKTQEELTDLVKKLKIQTVLGQEVLVIGS